MASFPASVASTQSYRAGFQATKVVAVTLFAAVCGRMGPDAVPATPPRERAVAVGPRGDG
ncbi:MAG: hypothetical protein NTY02_15295 [Acidobacteria bacterium]|nr:hypothetical protein [Acidobacteriota bacterium]